MSLHFIRPRRVRRPLTAAQTVALAFLLLSLASAGLGAWLHL